MEHTNKIIISVLKEEFADYDYNTWHYDSQYRMIEKAIERTLNPPLKTFKITYKFLNRTDASLHEETVTAENVQLAVYDLLARHNHEIEWHTVKEL